MTISRYRQEPVEAARETMAHWYFLGAGLTLWCRGRSAARRASSWARDPASWSLDFTLPLTFIALLVPTLHDRPAILAALA